MRRVTASPASIALLAGTLLAVGALPLLAAPGSGGDECTPPSGMTAPYRPYDRIPGLVVMDTGRSLKGDDGLIAHEREKACSPRRTLGADVAECRQQSDDDCTFPFFTQQCSPSYDDGLQVNGVTYPVGHGLARVNMGLSWRVQLATSPTDVGIYVGMREEGAPNGVIDQPGWLPLAFGMSASACELVSEDVELDTTYMIQATIVPGMNIGDPMWAGTIFEDGETENFLLTVTQAGSGFDVKLCTLDYPDCPADHFE